MFYMSSQSGEMTSELNIHQHVVIYFRTEGLASSLSDVRVILRCGSLTSEDFADGWLSLFLFIYFIPV